MPHAPLRTSPLLVERDAEFVLVEGALARAADATCQVLLLSGEAGVGKTRLTRAATQRATALGFEVLAGQCSERDREFPFAPFVDALRQSLVALPDPAALLGSQGEELIELLPEYAAAISGGTIAGDISPEQRKRRLFEAFVALIARRAAVAPQLVVLEDLHWSDPTSFELLELLPHRLASTRLCIIGTSRPDEMGQQGRQALLRLHRSRAIAEVTLRPLSREGVGEMLRAMLPVPPPQDLVSAMADRTGGNPFFIEELVASGYASGTWLEERFLVPTPIRDLVLQQLEGLDPATIRILDLATVAGERVSFDLLLRLAGVGRDKLVARLRLLVARGLLMEQRGGGASAIRFRHALTRDALLDRLLLPERQPLHRLVADAVERDAGSSPSPGVLGELGYHFSVAEEWEKALAYAARAGQAAMEMQANAEAYAHFRRALDAATVLDHPDRPWLEIRCGQALAILGRFGEARAHLERALDQAERAADTAVALEATWTLAGLFASRDYPVARAHAERALELARALGDLSWEARALNRLGNILTNMMHFAEGRALHESALRLVEGSNDAWGSADTLDYIGMARYLTGDARGAREAFGAAAAIFLENGDLERAASALTSRSLYISVLDGACETDVSPSLARPEAARGLEICREIGWRGGEAYALIALATIDLGEAGIADAVRNVEAALAIARDIDHQQWIVFGHLTYGVLHAGILDEQRALEHFGRGREIARAIGSQQWLDRLDAWIGRCDPGAAAASAGSVRDIPLETMGHRLRLLAAIERALARGRWEEARDLGERFRAEDGAFRSAEPALLYADALAGLDRRGEADAAYEQARRLVLRFGPRGLLWRVAAGRSRLWGGIDSRIASAESESARRLLEEIAAAIPDDAWRAVFLQHPRTRPWLDPALQRQTPAMSAPGGLTPREREIAACVAHGMSNKEIARSLSISERTVEAHVGGCLAKLGFPSRSRLAVWAAGQGLSSVGGPGDDPGFSS